MKEMLESVERTPPLAPKTVDFNVIGRCNLKCEWCWGPDHKVKESLTTENWIEIGKQLEKLGTENVILTGGEPLLRSDLNEIVVGLKQLGLRVTLSTNGMLLSDKNRQILQSLDEIGLPIDGSSEKMNSAMRKGNPRSFDLALKAIKYMQENFPAIKLTVRTVLSKKNAQDVQNIPQTLISNGIDIKTIRWKIYQIAATGPTKEHILSKKDEWLIDQKDAADVVSAIREKYPEIAIQYQTTDAKLNRYLHIDQVGNMFTLVGDGTEEKPVGTVFNQEKKLSMSEPLADLHNSPNKITDHSHGSDNF